MYNIKHNIKPTTEKDELFTVIEMMKDDNAIVRTCELGNDILILVCYDWQLENIEKF